MDEPILWNLLLMLDPLLRDLQARGEYVQTFAEDVGAGL